jgi:predicted kinase
MSKILVLQGVPASGKTTWAREFVKGKTDWVIVNRDSLRNMRGDYLISSQEDYISDIEQSAVEFALKRNLNIIIDATNLNPNTVNKWKTISSNYNAEIEFKEFKITFKEAVERDSKRENPVGEKVIKRFFRMYYPEQLVNESLQTVQHYRIPINNGLPKAVICDIDGTLAWMQNRSPYDYTKVKDDFYDDGLVRLLIKLYNQGIQLIIVSGREASDQCTQDTLDWLHKKFDNFIFYQRRQKDYRPDEIIKEEIYHNCIEGQYDIMCVFDDRNKVVNMWRNLGLLCCQVNEGDF